MREGPRTGIGKRERKDWSCGPSGSGVSAQVKGECKGKAGGLVAGLFTLHIKLNSGNVWCPVDSDAHPVVEPHLGLAANCNIKRDEEEAKGKGGAGE